MDNQVSSMVKKERVKTLLSLSKELEVEYMHKFIGRELEFIPETYQNGYLFGHTGNYLSIKTKGEKELINKIVKIKVVDVSYPYCLSNICKDTVDIN